MFLTCVSHVVMFCLQVSGDDDDDGQLDDKTADEEQRGAAAERPAPSTNQILKTKL